MDFTGIGEVADLIKDGINKIWPDKTQEQQAQTETLLAELDARLKEAQAQLEVDKQEAASTSTFVAGWRPFVGWVCGCAFAWQFVGQPVLSFILKVADPAFNLATLPVLDVSAMMPVLLGMLGLGGMRSYEKMKGVNGRHG